VEAKDIYARVEKWWGNQFDDNLVAHISNAPHAHILAFAESLDEIDMQLPEMRPGILRPFVSTAVTDVGAGDRLSAALRLLLYAHEVVLDFDIIDIFDGYRLAFYGQQDHLNAERERLKNGLFTLVRIRPLVVDGSIRFTPIRSRGLHPSLMSPMQDFFETDDGRALIEEVHKLRSYPVEMNDWDPAWAVMFLLGEINAACSMAQRRLGHPLARSSLDALGLRRLLQRPIMDQRYASLKTLASLKVPGLNGDIDSMVKIRASETQFAEWRTHLSRALAHVGELSDTEDTIKEASELVSAELSEGLLGVQKATRKSPALKALSGSVHGFAISGVTAATTGAITGNPWVSLASGMAGKASDGVLTYLNSIRSQRKDRLILDVAAYFGSVER